MAAIVAPTFWGWGVAGKVGAFCPATEQSHLDTIFVPRSRQVRSLGLAVEKSCGGGSSRFGPSALVTGLVRAQGVRISPVMASIRLIGPHHSCRSTVLTIGDETAAHNGPNIVTLEHARNLVAYGVAEWVGEPPDEPHD